MKEKRDNLQSGQIGLVVLLIMTTMLTVGIGAVSQSTRDLRITRQEVEASQVFNAAEAGIEAGLSDIDSGAYGGGTQTGSFAVDDIDVSYEIAESNVLDAQVLENQVAVVDTGYLSGNSVAGEDLRITWGSGQSCPNKASIVVKVYNSNDESVWTGGYGCSGQGDEFADGSSGSITLTLNDGDAFVRVRPVYFDTNMVIAPNVGGSWSLPVQYHSITARASRPTSGETKVIQLDKTLETAPSVFDYALFSGTSLIL